MTTEQAMKWAGGEQELAAKLGVTRQAVNYWAHAGLPDLRQYQLQVLSNGRLRHDNHPRVPK